MKKLILVALLFALPLIAQDKPKMEPTETEMLQLQVAQKDAIIASQKLENLQIQYQVAQADAQLKLAQLRALASKIQTAHKWDATFNESELTFTPVEKKLDTTKSNNADIKVPEKK